MKKILVIRFSSIGDIILTTPVIRCLKQQLPGIELHYLTRESFAPVLLANPYIDRLHTIRKSIREILPALKQEKFDLVIDLHKNFRSAGVILGLRRPARGFNKLNIRKWLLVRFRVNLLPDIHIVDRYFGTVIKLGVTNDLKGLDYFIPEQDEVNPAILPETHQTGYTGWVIGGKHNTKIYPEEKVIEACKTWNVPIVLLGGPEDTARGERIREAVGPLVFNACGKFSINQSASLVRQARRIITNDTGLMHAAAAFGKEIISLWGNTVPAFGMYPYLPGQEYRSRILEVKGLKCRPCSKLGYSTCPKKHFRCMNELHIPEL